MNRKTLFAVMMAVIMVFSGAAFAGGVTASENTEFDGEEVSEIDQTDTVYFHLDGDLETVTVAMTDTPALADAETVTYEMSVHADDAEVDHEDVSAEVTDEGDVEVTASASVDAEDYEVLVTVDAAQVPYVLSSEDAESVDDSAESSITFDNDTNDGERMVVSASHDEDFFVVFYEVDDDEIDTDEELGESSELDAGEYSVINVDLNQTLDEDQDVGVMLHESDDGEPGDVITDGAEEDIQDTASIEVDDVVMNSTEVLITGPDEEEEHNYQVLHPDEVIDLTVSVEDADFEFDNGTLEADEDAVERDGELVFEVTRNDTEYEDVDLSENVTIEIELNSDFFSEIEDVTDEDALNLTDDTEDDGVLTFVYEVDDDEDFTDDTYELRFDVMFELGEDDDVVTMSSTHNPAGGVAATDTQSYGYAALSGIVAPDFFSVPAPAILWSGLGVFAVVGGIFAAHRQRDGSDGIEGLLPYDETWKNAGWGILFLGGIVAATETALRGLSRFEDMTYIAQLVADTGLVGHEMATTLVAIVGIVAITIAVALQVDDDLLDR